MNSAIASVAFKTPFFQEKGRIKRWNRCYISHLKWLVENLIDGGGYPIPLNNHICVFFFFILGGYGNFTFRMDFYRTAAFTTPYTENDYPIYIPLNEFLYVKYSVESSADLVIMAENCKATKYGNFYSLPQYTVIQNG